MRKAAVPVPYIIAIVIAIAVIALLGYWFFVIGGGLWGGLTEEQCRQKLITYCVQWSANGYKCLNPDTPAGACSTEDPPTGLADIELEMWADYEPRCTAYSLTIGEDGSMAGCKETLGQT